MEKKIMRSGVTLNDLKFIENPKNRRAFLIALREVEEEGFEIFDKEESLNKIHELETKAPETKAKSLDELTQVAIGSTPASRASDYSVRKRNFTNTNAVDLKEYKYWRDPDFTLPGTAPKKSMDAPKRPSSSFARPSFDDFFMDDTQSRPAPKTDAKNNSKLYDELFSEIVKDHEPKNRTIKTKTYETLERASGSGEFVEDNKKTIDDIPQTRSVNKYATAQYRANAKKRMEKFLELQAAKKKEENDKKRAEDRKKLEEQKALEETIDSTEEVESEKPVTKEKKTPSASDTDKTQTETQEKPKTRKKSNKLVVEVIAPPEEEKPKKTSTKKKSTTTKPRKRKKKLDADIKIYRHINID